MFDFLRVCIDGHRGVKIPCALCSYRCLEIMFQTPHNACGSILLIASQEYLPKGMTWPRNFYASGNNELTTFNITSSKGDQGEGPQFHEHLQLRSILGEWLASNSGLSRKVPWTTFITVPDLLSKSCKL